MLEEVQAFTLICGSVTLKKKCVRNVVKKPTHPPKPTLTHWKAVLHFQFSCITQKLAAPYHTWSHRIMCVSLLGSVGV